jgi:hypothetical protein
VNARMMPGTGPFLVAHLAGHWSSLWQNSLNFRTTGETACPTTQDQAGTNTVGQAFQPVGSSATDCWPAVYKMDIFLASELGNLDSVERALLDADINGRRDGLTALLSAACRGHLQVLLGTGGAQGGRAHEVPAEAPLR